MKRKNKKLTCLIIVLIVVAVYGFFNNPDHKSVSGSDQSVNANDLAGESEDVSSELSKAYDVIRVVDGDTIIVDINGTEERVRMIGIDTPESVHPDAEKNTQYGKVASQYTSSRLEGQQVSLEYDVEERDKYGRLLAYVYLDGEMFNAELVRKGYAMVYTYPPNVKYVDTFTQLQKEARSEKLGVWAEYADSGDYLASIKGSKYHLPSCSVAAGIDEDNLIWFADMSAAEEAGYEPCSKCIK